MQLGVARSLPLGCSQIAVSHLHSRPSRVAARFTAETDIELLVQQARVTPSVDTTEPPAEAKAKQSVQDPYASARAVQSRPVAHGIHQQTAYVQPLAQQQQPQQQPQQHEHDRVPVPSKKLRPSKLDFGVMFGELQVWQQRYLTSHVPRHCFDAPELGAWVRFIRKQHIDGLLEQWKVDRLNELCFEWELTDQDAKWHHLYHQMRRYRLMYGNTDLHIPHTTADDCDWQPVARWLHKQARLLAKQKLSSQKRAMLEQLGVTLTIPKHLVQRTAQLQALNGMERRKLRKKWKQLDEQEVEAQWQRRQRELQQQQQQLRQQRQLVQRRQQLLREAAHEVSAAAAQHSQDAPQQQHDSSAVQRGAASGSLLWQPTLALLQQLHQQPQQELLSQQQEDQKPNSSTNRALVDSSSHGSTAHQRPVDQESPAQQTGLAPEEQAPLPMSSSVLPQQVASGSQPEQQQEQQRQGPRWLQQQHGSAGPLLYRPNRRRQKMQNRSRQEKWLTAVEEWPEAQQHE